MTEGPVPVSLSKEDAESLGLREGEGRLAIGRRVFETRLSLGDAPPGWVQIPFSALRAAPLYNLAGPIGLFAVPERATLHLGPVVGVMVGCPPAALPPDESYFLRRAHAVAAAKGIVLCTFTPAEADLTTRTTTGFQPGGAGPAWLMLGFPLPDVVHNRTTLLAPQYSEAYGKVLGFYAAEERTSEEHSADAGPVLFTKGGLTKVKALGLMTAHSLAAAFVPPTAVIDPTTGDPDDLFRAIAALGQVFLKPQAGSQGEGIFRVTAPGESGGSYLVEFRRGEENVAARCEGPDAVLDIVEPALAKTSHLCQKAIDRPEVDGSPLDFRAYLTRNGAGEWLVCYLCGRHARGGAICSHRRFGGVVTAAGELLEKAFPGRAGEVAKAIANCAGAAAAAVSGHEAGDCCELAADIAVDRAGRPWILEVNDCPNRLPPDEDWVREATEVAMANLLDYFLAAAERAAGAATGRRRLVRIMPS